jgi:antitoxin (DNA-binding transcriptional repressor) of toxin-antitoxin stability system
MKHMRVAEARARFGEILDEAEKGTPVTIERRGVVFRLVAEPLAPSAPKGKPLFDHVDTSVLSGQWTWTHGEGGLSFSKRGKRP